MLCNFVQSVRADALPSISLHGTRVHSITENQCVRHVIDSLENGQGGVVVTPNLDHLRRAQGDPEFRALLESADVVVADGMPLVWASKLQATPLPQRVAGSNLIWSLSEAAAENGKSIFLLGGDPRTADTAARTLVKHYLRLRIAGTCCPEPGFENDPQRVEQILADLRAKQPDIIFVALGSPKQEQLIARLRAELPAAWWLGVGISFSFVSGDVKRAPRWMQKCGLEWTHRLAQEPRRLFKRYVVSGPPFAMKLLGGAAVRGIPNRLRRGSLETAVTTNRAIADVASAARKANLPIQRNIAEPSRPGVPRALVLLGGSVRPSPLSLSTGRSVLDLPLENGRTVLTHWLEHAVDAAKAWDVDQLPVRVMVNPAALLPTGNANDPALSIERDASEYRGTGGVIRDVADDYHDDDLLLVANAAQLLLQPLATLAADLQDAGADVALVSHADGTPSGLMLVRCRALRSIATSGFIDMKEQALPRIATRFDVRVLNRLRPTGLPLRTLEDYILALRQHHTATDSGAPNPFAEDWQPAFSLVEPGAKVHPTARVHDSVVLAGGVVEAGAVLVRSIVCRGGVVRSEKSVVDSFVGENIARKSEQRAA